MSYKDNKLNSEVIKTFTKFQLVAIDNFENAIKLLDEKDLKIIDIDGTIRILDKNNEHDDVDSLDDASLYMEYDMESYNN